LRAVFRFISFHELQIRKFADELHWRGGGIEMKETNGRTLWEMFTGLFDSPAANTFFNPLQAKPKAGFTIDDIEWRDRDFRLDEIRDYRRQIEGKEFAFADYVLVDRSLHGEEMRIRLRVNPVADPAAAGISHHALLLKLEDDLAYNKELHAAVQSDTKVFQIHHDGGDTEEFSRLNNVADSYKAKVSILRDGKEAEKLQLEYWDYAREVPDAAGQPTTEYLFVEMNSDSGWFQLWRGSEVDPHKVVVM
jgi:hypothetical protein